MEKSPKPPADRIKKPEKESPKEHSQQAGTSKQDEKTKEVEEVTKKMEELPIIVEGNIEQMVVEEEGATALPQIPILIVEEVSEEIGATALPPIPETPEIPEKPKRVEGRAMRTSEMLRLIEDEDKIEEMPEPMAGTSSDLDETTEEKTKKLGARPKEPRQGTENPKKQVTPQKIDHGSKFMRTMRRLIGVKPKEPKNVPERVKRCPESPIDNPETPVELEAAKKRFEEEQERLLDEIPEIQRVSPTESEVTFPIKRNIAKITMPKKEQQKPKKEQQKPKKAEYRPTRVEEEPKQVIEHSETRKRIRSLRRKKNGTPKRSTPTRSHETGERKGTANITWIPPEILMYILSFLSYKDIENCCKAHEFWDIIVHGFHEYFWMELCFRDYEGVYLDAYRKSGLNWRQLCESLNLWPEIQNTSVSVTFLPYRDIVVYFCLANNIISFPQRCSSLCPEVKYDTIVYYNILKMTEVRRKRMKICFRDYKETDNLIAVDWEIMNNFYVVLMPKTPNARVYRIKVVKDKGWLLYGNDIYYETEDPDTGSIVFCRLKVVFKEDGVEYVNQLLTGEMTGDADIADVMCYEDEDKEEHVAILSVMGNGNIQTSILDIMHEHVTCYFNSYEQEELVEAVRAFGFSLCVHKTFYWTLYRTEDLRFCHYNVVAPYEYTDICLVAGKPSQNKIKIFYKPFDARGNLILQEASKTKSINLSDYVKPPLEKDDDMNYGKIEVVEKVRGHKIIVLRYCLLFVVDLSQLEKKKYSCFASL